ncbi:hypothetical protein GCM10009431_03740 [Gaetbulibacter jejuensis]|uniref:Uncharacterized protein n=1 Tax=Gaetbulibacter jejuensis TaxID=584607 RepID=A0ABN1JE69_9FLAO
MDNESCTGEIGFIGIVFPSTTESITFSVVLTKVSFVVFVLAFSWEKQIAHNNNAPSVRVFSLGFIENMYLSTNGR